MFLEGSLINANLFEACHLDHREENDGDRFAPSHPWCPLHRFYLFSNVAYVAIFVS